MGSICGWIGAFRGSNDPERVIARMAMQRATAAIPLRGVARAEVSAGLFIGRPGDRDCDTRQDPWVAIEGRPRWTTDALAARAERDGHAAALREAYARHGTALLKHVTGHFALAVVDSARERLLLAIDRSGCHRFCYSRLGSGALVFGATTDAVAGHPDVGATVTPQAIFDFLYFCCCPSPETIYSEQRKLLPAQYLFYDRGALTVDFYWRMPYLSAAPARLSNLGEELRSTLRRVVARSVAGHKPETIGAFLSGGLDSSTMVGLLAEAQTEPVKSFTIGFSQDRYDETRYSRIAAKHFGSRNYEYFLRAEDVAGTAELIARHFDEPFANTSVFPAYFCAKLAREHGVSLMVAGDGGDEIFGGNSRYVDQKIFELYGRIPSALRSHLIEPLLRGLPEHGVPSLLRRARSYVRQAQIPLPDRLYAGHFYQRTSSQDLFEPDAAAKIDGSAPLTGLREAYSRADTASSLQRMLHLDLKITLADNDLRKVSGACELAGIAVEYPFLDQETVEFSGRVPPSLLIRHLDRRYFFKQAMRDFLPTAVLEKKKHGFGMPYAEWARESPTLRQLALDCVASFRRRGYLRSEFLDRISARQTAPDGNADDGVLLDIMMLELWFSHREQLRQLSTPPPIGLLLDAKT